MKYTFIHENKSKIETTTSDDIIEVMKDAMSSWAQMSPSDREEVMSGTSRFDVRRDDDLEILDWSKHTEGCVILTFGLDGQVTTRYNEPESAYLAMLEDHPGDRFYTHSFNMINLIIERPVVEVEEETEDGIEDVPEPR
jgi:hypothetical protein